jgi:type IV secretion system protein VirD4
MDTDPFWDNTAETIIAGSILFLAMYVPRQDRNLGLLHRMWSVADHLNEMLAVMSTSEVHGGVMAGSAKTYIDAPEKTAGSIITTMRQHLAFLGSAKSRKSLAGDWGLLKKIADGARAYTVYLRVPPHLLTSHAPLLRIWLGSLIAAVAERKHRPVVPDLFLVDEAATVGRLDELLTAASLLRGYGLRTWTFWQSLSQLQGIYGHRAGEFLDNASTLMAFGASNAANAQAIADVTGYQGRLLGMPKDVQVLCRQGEEPQLVTRINYLRDPVYRGLFDPNPFHGQAAVGRGLEVVA